MGNGGTGVELFYILILMVVIPLYKFVKTQNYTLKIVNFTTCKLYFKIKKKENQAIRYL